ncbi:MAG: hypothetical protein AAF662_01355 [Pseudomonadota bacterium]
MIGPAFAVVFFLVASVSLYIFGPLFGCRLSIGQAASASLAGALLYTLPTVGAYLSWAAMCFVVWRSSDGDPMNAMLLAGLARLLTIPGVYALANLF